MSKHTSDILTFMQHAKKGDNSRKLRGLIEHIPSEAVTSWRDDDGLDLLHHVILANNSEVVEYLLHQGFFVRPHRPEVSPYSHLAALLGERTLLQVLLQYRPDDYYPEQMPIRLPEKFLETLNGNKKYTTNRMLQLTKLKESSSTSSLNSTSSKSSSSSSSSSTPHQYQIESVITLLENLKLKPKRGISPLELAARAGHLQCVSVILNQCVLKRHSEDNLIDKSDLTLACVADSPQTVALIMDNKSPSKTEWEAAVDVCLHHAHAECLDLLLQQGKDRSTKHMFKGMNFYHVLYTYTSVHGARSYSRLAQTTEVLVKHGHDVLARLPCRTYPMYSLLTHAFCFHDYENTQYYVRALRVLLKHGANPNFDEVKFERRNAKHAANKISGRQAFSSALHCLMETVETYAQYLKSPALAVNFVEDCAGVLMHNKASMNHVGNVGDPDKMTIQGSVLHQLAKSSVTLGVNQAMIRCVLRHGADPNLKVDGKYAINVYFDKLFEKMRSLKVVDVKNAHMNDAMMMCRLCMFMKPAAIRECLAIFVKDHKGELSPQVQPYLKAVKEELSHRSKAVHPLRDASAWAVWMACGRQFERVHQLKVSSELKTYILPMAF